MRANVSSITALALTATFVLSGYNCNDVLEDPGFDLWCGERLCAWQLEDGALARVDTWHRSDAGVELMGSHAAISQLVDRSGDSLRCLRFELMAHVEESAIVTLELDFFADGSVEHEQIIPTSSWAKLSYRLRMPESYDGILFRIRKRGNGRAMLAEVAALAESASACADLPAPASVPHPLGAVCTGDDVCASGTCAGHGDAPAVCGTCADSEDCAGGEACGLTSPGLARFALHRACVPAGAHGLAERCAEDAECATGICAGAVCSTCRDDEDCAGSQRCFERALEGGGLFAPRQCEPDAGLGLRDEPCLAPSDCESDVCQGQGERRVCSSDGRACAEDGDCPRGRFAEPGVCVTVGVADGTCQ